MPTFFLGTFMSSCSVQKVEKYWYDIEKEEDKVESRYLEQLRKEEEKEEALKEGSESLGKEVKNSSLEDNSWMNKMLKVVFGMVKNMKQGVWRVDRVIEGGNRSLEVFRSDFSIRSFSWHPYLAKFAISPQDHSIRIYDMNVGAWSPVILKHEFQRNIFSLAWKPLSGNTLAVGTRHGILIWHIIKGTSPSTSGGSRQTTGWTPTTKSSLQTPSTSFLQNMSTTTSTSSPQASFSQDTGAWCQYLHRFGHSPINALSWSPSGRFLAAGSIHHDQLLVWDVVEEVAVPIVQQIPGGISKVLWSPNDEYVAVFSAKEKMFRVFHTRNWASEKWSEGLKAPVKGACWSGIGATSLSSSMLAFTVQDDCKVYVVKYERDGIVEIGRRAASMGSSVQGGRNHLPGSLHLKGKSSVQPDLGGFPFPWDAPSPSSSSPSAPTSSSNSAPISGSSGASPKSGSSGVASSSSSSSSVSSTSQGGAGPSSGSSQGPTGSGGSSSSYSSSLLGSGLSASSLSFVSLNTRASMASSTASFKGSLVAIADLSPYSVVQPTASRLKSKRAPTASPSTADEYPHDKIDELFGGVTSHLAWDPSSSRLAVGFQGSEIIAVFQTNSLHTTSLHPLGYLRGPPDTELTGLEFRPSFERGALLAAHFSNGKISFFPLYFKPDQHSYTQ
jgi:hypothetical protein